MPKKVKDTQDGPRRRRRGVSRLSSKNQITIPVEVLRRTGIKPGDEVRVEADENGGIVVKPEENWVERFAGSVPPGTFPPGWLEELRSEWED